MAVRLIMIDDRDMKLMENKHNLSSRDEILANDSVAEKFKSVCKSESVNLI